MIRGTLLTGCILFVIGCATTRASINSYVDPAFEPGLIEKMAVFPIRNARFAPSESQEINRRISRGLLGRNPSLQLMAGPEAVNLLNERGLAEDWARFVENFVISGVPDAQRLRRIGDALGVEAIVQGEVVNLFQVDGQYGKNRGQTRVTIRVSMLSVTDGKMIWEATSDGIVMTASNMGQAPPVIDAVLLAVDKIVENLPSF